MLETKKFYHTSEFWIFLGSQIGTILSQLTQILPPKYGIPLQNILVIGYMISRGLAKSGIKSKI